MKSKKTRTLISAVPNDPRCGRAGAAHSRGVRCDSLRGGAQSHVLRRQLQPGGSLLSGRESNEQGRSGPADPGAPLSVCGLRYVSCLTFCVNEHIHVVLRLLTPYILSRSNLT